MAARTRSSDRTTANNKNANNQQHSSTKSKQRWSLIYAFLFGCIVTYAFQHIINTNTNVNRMDALLLSSSSSFDPPPPTTTATKIIYGHLHYIKSAGTNLNGQLASLCKCLFYFVYDCI